MQSFIITQACERRAVMKSSGSGVTVLDQILTPAPDACRPYKNTVSLPTPLLSNAKCRSTGALLSYWPACDYAYEACATMPTTH